MIRNFCIPGKTPHEQAQVILNEVKVEAVQHTDNATYYGFHQNGCLSIIILWKDGRAQLYECRDSWLHIINNVVFWYNLDKIKFDKETTDLIWSMRHPKYRHLSVEYTLPLGEDCPVTLEYFILIWGRKGYMRNFIRKSQHEVALEDLTDKDVVKFIGSGKTQYYAFHENGNLSIVMLYTDGTATRYDCKGTWDEIINKSEWFWKLTMEYVDKTNIDMELRKQLGKLALNHIIYHHPMTPGIDKDNIITPELFVKIWGRKGKFTEYIPIL